MLIPSLKKFLIQTNYAVFFSYTLKSGFKKKQRTKRSNVAVKYFPLPSVIITAEWKKSWKYEKYTMNIGIRIISYLQKNISGYWETFFPDFSWLITFKTKTSLTFPEFPWEALNLIWFSNFPWFSRSAGRNPVLLQFSNTTKPSPPCMIPTTR